MTKANLKGRIKEVVFLLDGAMGTELIVRGIQVGAYNEYLNVDSAGIISDIHNAYILAGSDAIITNTLGVKKYALARYGFADNATEINKAGARIARQAAGEEKFLVISAPAGISWSR
jgi:methionine synthase I (cobalamin-dependent)